MGTGVRRAECPIDRSYQESGGLAGVGSCSGGRLEDLCQVCIGKRFDKWWQLQLFIEIEFSNQTEDGKHRAVLETAPGKRGCHWCLASQSVKYEKTFLFWFLNNQEPWRRSRRSSQSSERRTRSWRKRFCKPIYFSSGKASSTTVSSKSLSTWVSWMMLDKCCVCQFLVGLWVILYVCPSFRFFVILCQPLQSLPR